MTKLNKNLDPSDDVVNGLLKKRHALDLNLNDRKCVHAVVSFYTRDNAVTHRNAVAA